MWDTRSLEETEAQGPVVQDFGKETEVWESPGCGGAMRAAKPASSSTLALLFSLPVLLLGPQAIPLGQQLQWGWNCKNLSSILELTFYECNEQMGHLQGR